MLEMKCTAGWVDRSHFFLQTLTCCFFHACRFLLGWGRGRGRLRRRVFLDLLQHLAEEHVEQALKLRVRVCTWVEAGKAQEGIDQAGEGQLTLKHLIHAFGVRCLLQFS